MVRFKDFFLKMLPSRRILDGIYCLVLQLLSINLSSNPIFTFFLVFTPTLYLTGKVESMYHKLLCFCSKIEVRKLGMYTMNSNLLNFSKKEESFLSDSCHKECKQFITIAWRKRIQFLFPCNKFSVWFKAFHTIVLF